MPITGGGGGGISLGTSANPFPSTGFYIYDTGGSVEWIVTVDTSGHLVTTAVSNSPTTFVFAGFLPLPQG